MTMTSVSMVLSFSVLLFRFDFGIKERGRENRTDPNNLKLKSYPISIRFIAAEKNDARLALLYFCLFQYFGVLCD